MNIKNKMFLAALQTTVFNLATAPPSLVTNGLVLWYKGVDFTNSPQTTTLTDRSGNGNTAAASGFAYTAVSGSDGNGGIVTDGVDDKLTVSNTFNLSAFTAQFKLKIDTQSVYGRIFSMNSDAQYLYIDYTTHSLKTLAGTYTGFTYTEGTTYDICQTYDGTNYKLYVNGSYISSLARSSDVLTSIMFGNKADNTRGLKGTLYNIALYNRALSGSEVSQNYNATK